LFPADAGLGGPPRPGVGPVSPAREACRPTRGTPKKMDNLLHLDKDRPMSFRQRWDRVDADKDSLPLFLPGCRESADGPRPSRAMVMSAFSGQRPAKGRRPSCRSVEKIHKRTPFDNCTEKKEQEASLNICRRLPSSFSLRFSRLCGLIPLAPGLAPGANGLQPK
jgi:hypothetical protein